MANRQPLRRQARNLMLVVGAGVMALALAAAAGSAFPAGGMAAAEPELTNITGAHGAMAMATAEARPHVWLPKPAPAIDPALARTRSHPLLTVPDQVLAASPSEVWRARYAGRPGRLEDRRDFLMMTTIVMHAPSAVLVSRYDPSSCPFFRRPCSDEPGDVVRQDGHG